MGCIVITVDILEIWENVFIVIIFPTFLIFPIKKLNMNQVID